MNVLVTGANRGIGFGFVQEYVKRGAHVFAACRKPEQADKLKELQTAHRNQVIIVPLDVTDQAQINHCSSLVSQHATSLDRVINNAGILRPVESFRDISTVDLIESFAVNAVAPLRIIQHFEGLLAAGSTPRLINITGPTPSITNLPRRNNHIYLASRYPHNALTKLVAWELIEKGIVTIALWPGFLRTDMNHLHPEATPPEEGIPLAVNVIESLTTAHNGSCLLPDGSSYEW